MNIEDKLNELAFEAQRIPDRLNMETIVEKTKKRKTRHNIAFAGKVALSVAALLFVTLFIGVNASLTFARTATDLPVLGKFSSALILRSDIREALSDDIKEAIEAGDFTEVHKRFSGEKGTIDCEVKSFLADHLSFVFFMDMFTDLDLESQQYYLGDFHFVRLDDELPQKEQLLSSFNYHLGKESYVQLYDLPLKTDFAIEFSVFDCEPKAYFDMYDMFAQEDTFSSPELAAKNEENRKYNQEHTVDSFHIEFHDVVRKASKYYRINKSFTYEKQEITILEMMLYNTGTKLILERPNIPDFYAYGFEIYLTDEKGQVIADPFSHIETGNYAQPQVLTNFLVEGDQITEESFDCYILPSIYHKDVDKIQIHIKTLSGYTYDPNMLRIDPKNLTATFNGNSLPVKKYDSTYTYESFGLDLPMPAIEGDYCFFAVPKTSDMPAFNRHYDQLLNMFTEGTGIFYSLDLYDIDVSNYLFEPYPTATIDGTEYLLILFLPDSFSGENYYDLDPQAQDQDTCYYFAAADPQTVVYTINQKVDVDAK
ncbi:MAG: hypothetical protein IKD90_12020 [Clostridiales bacterium]|nr:hypothetical protein [Clostridiales bacterium]